MKKQSRYFAIFFTISIGTSDRHGVSYDQTNDGSYLPIATWMKSMYTKKGVKSVSVSSIIEFKSYQDYIDAQR